MYYFARFKGYPVIVFALSKQKVLDRLVEFVRITKGNVVYSEMEIREQAEVIRCLDLIDDTSYLKKLVQIDDSLKDMKRKFDEQLREKELEIGKIQHSLRQVWEQVNAD